uniref:Amino acid transporter family protein n=1 Tax=Trepomonas sp. PC1 TaxID=1076344 RepID=A0A146KEZ9_9EUKA|eukprot:JAP95293.1 Amino acid transporter family protein [Trepomonas sp. PC1]
MQLMKDVVQQQETENTPQQPLKTKKDEVKGQLSSSAFTMLTQMLGSTMLAFPFVTYKLGWALTTFILIHSVVMTLVTMYYYTMGCYYTLADSYKELVVKVLGKKAGTLLDISLFVSYYGYMTSYVIVSSNGVTSFVLNNFNAVMNPYITKTVIVFVIMFPLCLLKSLKQVSKISTIAGMIIFVFVISMAVYFFMHVGSQTLCSYNGHDIKYSLPTFPRASFLESLLFFIMYIPSMFGNFSAHPVVPRFLKELVGPYPFKKILITKAIQYAVGIVTVCLVLVGYLGAWMFGEDIQQNILKAFAPCKDIYIDILSLFYAIVVIINFPLVLYPLKASLVQSFHEQMETKKGYRITIWIDLIFLVAALLLALFLESIVSIFGLFASIAGFVFYFLIPFYCFIVINKLRENGKHLDDIEDNGQPISIDSLSTAIITMATGNVEQARRLSMKMFGQNQVIIENGPRGRTASVVSERRQSKRFSIKLDAPVKKEKTEKKPGEESSDLVKDVALNAMQAVEEAQTNENAPTKVVEEIQIPKGLYKMVPKKRRVQGWVVIGIYAMVCTVGVIMNAMDVIKVFFG